MSLCTKSHGVTIQMKPHGRHVTWCYLFTKILQKTILIIINIILLYTSGFEMNLKVLPAMKMYTPKSHILLTSGCQTQHHAEMSQSSVS